MRTRAAPLEVAQSLQLATRQAYTDILATLKFTAPDTSLDEAQRMVLDVVQKTLQKCAREHNSVASVAGGMPNELLIEVFEFLPLNGRIATSHVCHAWRAASLGCPQRLWSVIKSTGRPTVLAGMLGRAGEALVSVQKLNVQRHTQAAFARHIKKHLHHIRELDVEFILREEKWWDEWDKVFKAPAPHIEMLTFGFWETKIDSMHWPKQLFANNAPRLRVLRLVDAVCNISSIAGLSSLEYISVSSHSIFADEIIEILTAFPRLLGLRIEGNREVFTDTSDRSGPITPPPTLETLYIRTPETPILTQIRFLVALIDYTVIPVLHWFMDPTLYLVPNVTTSFFKAPIQSISFRTINSQNEMRLVDSTGLIRIFMDVIVTSRLIQHFGPALSTASELTLIGCISNLPPAFWRSLPPITSITIVDDVDKLQSFASGGVWPYIRLRSIQTVRISPTSDDSQTSIFSMVTPLLHPFTFNPHKIEVLEIHGTTSQPTEEEALGDIAKEIKFYTEPLEVPWEEWKDEALEDEAPDDEASEDEASEDEASEDEGSE